MQKNSFVSLMEQLSIINKNSIEIITKLNDVVTANDSTVTIKFEDSSGNISSYSLPSVSYIQKEIEIANANIKKLSALEADSSVIIVEDNKSRKIKSVDLNREPNQINNLNLVSTFNQSNNWFFESLVNPLLAVNINLNDQIDDNVRKVVSKRYIIKFEKDTLTSEYTTNGLASLTYFQNTFLNRNDVNVTDLVNWLTNTTTVGVTYNIDEQIFDLNYKEINYKGYFSVMKLERDTLNNKFWYHLNTLSYFYRDGSSRNLVVGDILSIVKNNSYSKYQITEINTSSSLFRVALERIEGYDPVPVGTSVLEYYSSLTSQNDVKITIGFDEYNVVFLKPINTDNNILGSTWSKGMAFYTNDLTLDTDSNVDFVNYYLNSVYDYGALLKDMVERNIPTTVASTPNTPVLLTDNFKVVQINKHLTDTKDYNTLKKLHSQKNSIKAKIEQINEAITEKNREINTKNYKSFAEKSKAQIELDKLIKSQESETKLYSSYISQITNSVVDSSVEPKFRIRGFWNFPDPIINENAKPQEVIGFEIQYRYSSKLGSENVTEGFDLIENSRKNTAYYSKWVPYLTDIRKRSYNSTTGTWYWEIEDVSDADTPNINQLDIPIQRNERVDIRIRSISEVGYPDSKIMSDWSETLTIDFPDNLNNVLGENEFILKEANQEEIKTSFDNELSAKGINKHVQDSFYVNDSYFAHGDKTLATSFKDSLGNTLTLFDYLSQLTDKIKVLENAINRAKGELKVTLFNGTQETEITNNSVTNITINCEDYMLFSGLTTKTVQNNVYLIQDYYIKFENIGTTDLEFLCNKTHINGINSVNTNYTYGNPTLIDANGKLIEQTDNQFIWLLNEYNSTRLYSGSTAAEAPSVLSTDNKILSNFYNTYLLLGSSPNLWYSSTLTGEAIFGATVHPYVSEITDIKYTDGDIYYLKGQDYIKFPLNIYFKPDMSTTNAAITIATNSTAYIRNKRLKIRLDLEDKNQSFIFDIAFKLIRHKNFISTSPSTNTAEYILE